MRAKENVQNRDISSTFVKGMTVLQTFTDSRRLQTFAEIAALTNYDRAAVRRLVLSLVHMGFLDQSGRYFFLTPRVLGLAGNYLQSNKFGRLVQPVLNVFSNRLGSAISLAMVDDDQAIYVAQSTLQNSEVSFGFTVGSYLPLLHTAIGRAHLAFGNLDWADGILKNMQVHLYTSDTIQQHNTLRRKVAEVKSQGYAIVDGEFEPGVVGFAVPIGILGQTCAVVGASIARVEVAGEEKKAFTINMLQQCAVELNHTGLFNPTP